MDRACLEEAIHRWTSTPITCQDSIEAIKTCVQDYVEGQDEIAINKGDYDGYVAVSDIIASVDSLRGPELDKILNQIGLNRDDPDARSFTVVRCIEELEHDGILLYMYDRQRVRSRIAEIARYMALLKQRFDAEDYLASPGLTQMVKLRIKNRKKPDRNSDDFELMRVLRELFRKKNTEVIIDPAISSLVEERLPSAARELIETVRYVFGSERVKLSRFQAKSFTDLFCAAISKDFKSDMVSYIISAGTGSGKTEAFLFPTLLYLLLTRHISGTKALLIYPRIDLCNNQFERIAQYILYFNQRWPEARKIKVGVHHSQIERMALKCPYNNCLGKMRWDKDIKQFVCDTNDEHVIDFMVDKWAPADIIITTPDSLHRRLMDPEGYGNIWSKDVLPKFIVFDEAHIYTSQSGMHVANIVRRLRKKITDKQGKQGLSPEPIFIGCSATIGQPKAFSKKLFSTVDANLIEQPLEEMVDAGKDYILFIKATTTRKIDLPVDDGDDNTHFTIASNMSAMIQTAFCLQHNMRKDCNKNKVLGFVDSIDSIARLGRQLNDAEVNRGLYLLRTPDEVLGRINNPLCSHVSCIAMPPNPYIGGCQTYINGECWWLMREQDLDPCHVTIHKSGGTINIWETDGRLRHEENELWNVKISTSALEVGFDNPSIIATFQFRAPMSIPGFVQRIGRGGRGQRDMPISVVVLGSNPLDSFYFHHASMLTDPTQDKLEIPLDSDNRYIKSMHATSYVYDFISSRVSTKDELYDIYKGINVEATLLLIRTNHDQLLIDIVDVFEISMDAAVTVCDNVIEYLNSCTEPLLFGNPNSLYYLAVRANDESVEEIRESLKDIKRDIENLIGRVDEDAD